VRSRKRNPPVVGVNNHNLRGVALPPTTRDPRPLSGICRAANDVTTSTLPSAVGNWVARELERAMNSHSDPRLNAIDPVLRLMMRRTVTCREARAYPVSVDRARRPVTRDIAKRVDAMTRAKAISTGTP
jgi:hypothetical protein